MNILLPKLVKSGLVINISYDSDNAEFVVTGRYNGQKFSETSDTISAGVEHLCRCIDKIYWEKMSAK